MLKQIRKCIHVCILGKILSFNRSFRLTCASAESLGIQEKGWFTGERWRWSFGKWLMKYHQIRKFLVRMTQLSMEEIQGGKESEPGRISFLWTNSAKSLQPSSVAKMTFTTWRAALGIASKTHLREPLSVALYHPCSSWCVVVNRCTCPYKAWQEFYFCFEDKAAAPGGYQHARMQLRKYLHAPLVLKPLLLLLLQSTLVKLLLLNTSSSHLCTSFPKAILHYLGQILPHQQ